LALQLLKVNLYGGMQEQVGLQLPQAPTATATEMVRDIEGLITALETQQTELEQQIEQLTTVMLSGKNFTRLNQVIAADSPLAQSILQALPSLFALGDFTQQSETLVATTPISGTSTPNLLSQKLADLQAGLRTLKMQQEAVIAQQLQLTQLRDLAWETFKTLNNKVAELNLTRAAANSEVRFAANAVPPADPVEGISLVLAAIAAATAGLGIAIVVALMANSMQQPPFLGRNQQASVATLSQ
jgi:hypothetical protein